MDLIRNNMKLFKTFAMVFVVVALFILAVYFTFFYRSPNDVFAYKQYTTQEGEQRTKNVYCDEICRILKYDGWKKFRTILSPKFLEEKKFTDASFKEYLMFNGYYFVNTIEHKQFKTYKNGNKTIFVVDFRLNNLDNKVINIIESKPYDYYITIENDTYEEEVEKSKTSTVENMTFEIKRTYKDTKQITYDIKIINDGNDTVEFNFADLTRFKLITSDDNSYMLNNNVSEPSEDSVMGKGSYTKKQMIFYVPQEMQPKIKYLSITDVKINGQTKDILVPFF